MGGGLKYKGFFWQQLKVKKFWGVLVRRNLVRILDKGGGVESTPLLNRVKLLRGCFPVNLFSSEVILL